MHPNRRLVMVTAVLGSTLAASGCLPLAATGMAVGAMAALDRRTVGAQTEDTEIELRAGNRMPDAIKGARGVGIEGDERGEVLAPIADDDRFADERRSLQCVFQL